ncbi:diacylglycerol kinase family protein [Paenibacillus sp. NPDC058071]|uniref:diacylglycerol kinase family protein n=1 Tax=Paenibacillus sp. NPDC058071 TaxID=3346326 RepID=UPI0036D9D463
MARFMRSAALAWSGMMQAIRSQLHMKVHLVAAAVVIAVSAFLPLTRIEWAVLLLVIALVISLELVNTAIERTVDLASPDIHPLAKLAKDTAAGAVLLAAIVAIVIGLLILGPPLWHIITAAMR